jgi:hypothetical protein
MRKFIVILFCCAAFLAAHTKAKAQLTATFNTALHGQTVDGLLYAQIISSYSQVVYARINIRVREQGRGGQLLTVQSGYIPFKPGINTLSRERFARSSFRFAQTPQGMQLSQTNRFPEGEYEFCFEMLVGDEKAQTVDETFENCFETMVQPATPIQLINPADGDEMCDTRPNLTWQPPMPVKPTTRFRLILCELKEKQTDIEAINYNIPIVNMDGITGNTLFYPAKLPELQKNKKYVWQVSAYEEKSIFTRSEIWQFTVKCEDPKPPVAGDSYRELKEGESGGHYIAEQVLRFSFYNSYNAGNLGYVIESLTKPGVKIKDLPELKLGGGFNKYDLDLSENRFFKDGHEYLLKVTLPDGKTLSLKFIYKEKQ